jgi:rhomboid protease GluP
MNEQEENWPDAASAGVPINDEVADFWQTLARLTPRLYVTPTLVAASVALFALMLASGVHWLSPTTESLIRWGADFGPRTIGGEWWRLASSMFIHIGVIHVAFNMVVLWDVGHIVERLLGNVGFLLTYVVAGLAGSLASLWWNPYVVSAGASGAVFGAYGALLGFVAFRHDAVPREIRDRLLKSGLGFLVYNVLFGLSMKHIDMAAHAGGLAAGFLCGLVQSQRLSAAAAQGRLVRNLVVALLAALLLPAAAWGLVVRGQPADVEGAREDFMIVQQQTVDRVNAATAAVDAGEMTDLEFAAILENEVLPAWRTARTRLESVRDRSSGTTQREFDRMVKYVRARQEGWELEVEAIGENDQAKHALARERLDEANRMAQEADDPAHVDH